jgi:hypothetical protein
MRPELSRWSKAVRRCLAEEPPRTTCGWKGADWAGLAHAFSPNTLKSRERNHLRNLLLGASAASLGALPVIWRLQSEFDDADFREEPLHRRLEKEEPRYAPLIGAIRAYEKFARSLQDAFDLLKAEAATFDAEGFIVSEIAHDRDFLTSIDGLPTRFAEAHRALAGDGFAGRGLQASFDHRFGVFSEPLGPEAVAIALCAHHERVQKEKSVDGKRPWFDRLGGERIYVRHRYREPRRPPEPDHYVHDYRGKPIRRFHSDLA